MRLPTKFRLLASIFVGLLADKPNKTYFRFQTNAEDRTTLGSYNQNLQNTSTNGYSNDATSDDVRILREICPANFCTYNGTDEYALNVIEQNKVCCLPCVCSVECFEIGNCCYGKDESNKRPRAEELELCTQTVIGVWYRRRLSVQLNFMLYQHCNKTENDTLVHKCHATSEVDLNEYIPAYSGHTGRHYRNKYCARCNEDNDNLTDWIQELRCISHIHMMNLHYNESFQRTNIIHRLKNGIMPCELQIEPPDGINATKCIHPRDIISTCESFSPSYAEYEKKCRTFHAPVVHEGFVYKNVFCLMCNDLIVSFEDSECFANETKEPEFPFESFMAVLTSNEAVHLNLIEKNLSNSNICTSPATFNEEINGYINVRCPLTMLRTGNQCYKVFATLANVNLDFRVDAVYPISEEYGDTEIFHEVLRLFIHSNYRVCDFSVAKRDVVGENIHINALLKITLYDQIELEDVFKSFVNNIDEYNSNTSNILKMKVGSGPLLIPSSDQSLAFPSYNYKNDYLASTCLSIAMSEIMFCPLVVLNEYTKMSDDTIRVDKMIFKEGEFVSISGSKEETRIYVCMDAYINRYKKSRRERSFQVCKSGYEPTLPVISYYVGLIIFILPFVNYYIHS